MDSTVNQFKKIIQKGKKDLAIYDMELWRVKINFNKPFNELNKYTIMLSYFDVSIEKELGGERMSKQYIWLHQGMNKLIGFIGTPA